MILGSLVAMVGLGLGPGEEDRIVVRVPVDERGRIYLRSDTNRRGRPRRGISVRGPSALVARSLLSALAGPGVEVGVTREEATLTLRPSAMASTATSVRDRLARLADDLGMSPVPDRYGITARPSYRPNSDDRPTVCLVHGINSTAASFRNLAPALEAEGFGVVTYDYPYDRDLDESARDFAEAWSEFRRERGEVRPWAILTHSMGSLVARSYVEGELYAGDVSHLILIGPTNSGAAVARGQTVLQVARGLKSADADGVGKMEAFRDGLGAAAEDLAPGSRFLRELNARPRRERVAYSILAGDAGFLTREQRARIEGPLVARSKSGGFLGGAAKLAASSASAMLDEMTDGTGDGCVSVASTRLDGVDDHEVIEANHVELIRGPLLYPDPGPVACMPFVVKRLRADPKGVAR